jgi:hypothetical protein
MPTVAGILQGSVATGEGLGDGVGLAVGDASGEPDDAALVLPHAHSTIIARRAPKRMRGTIAGIVCVFAY